MHRVRQSPARLFARCTLLVLAFLSLQRSAAAADETMYLKKPPSVLSNPETYIQGGVLTYANARKLVKVAFPDQDPNDPDFYCAIHVLEWGADTSTIEQSHWYAYRGAGSSASYGGRWSPARFTGTRLYGTGALAVLYVHVNVPASTIADATSELTRKIPAAARGAEPIKKLLPQGGQPSADVQSARGQALASIDNYVVERNYLAISYQIDVVKKLPAPVQNLTDALGMLQGAAAEGLSVALDKRVALYAADTFEIHHMPSDITISGKLTVGPDIAAKTIELGKQTYDNEGLYYWDVSLGIPISSVTQLDFETSGGQVFAKQVDSAQLLALANVFIRPVDTKNVKFQLVPSPIVGLALSKKPLTKVLVGLSIGLNKVQVFGGRQWTEVKKAPVAGAAAADAAAGGTQYQQDWVAGINVPVRQVIDFLKAKK